MHAASASSTTTMGLEHATWRRPLASICSLLRRAIPHYSRASRSADFGSPYGVSARERRPGARSVSAGFMRADLLLRRLDILPSESFCCMPKAGSHDGRARDQVIKGAAPFHAVAMRDIDEGYDAHHHCSIEERCRESPRRGASWSLSAFERLSAKARHQALLGDDRFSTTRRKTPQNSKNAHSGNVSIFIPSPRTLKYAGH